MILIPDDEPELSLPAVVIPPGDEFLPALSGEMRRSARPGLPAFPQFPRSRQTMASFLSIVASMLGAASWSPAAGAACAVIT
jgi:hypothetical protein